MSASPKSKESNLPTVLRRMRESSGLTMRQAAGIVGISHVAISQFENGKLSLPAYRIEALVKTYGFTKEEFHKIMGHEPVVNLRDDCHAMIDRMSDKQVEAIRAVMVQLASAGSSQCKTEEDGKCTA
jgi:transcriptional regulator with XRE-family HTH domain